MRVAVFKLQLAQLHLPVRPLLPWFLCHSLCLTSLYIRLSRFLYEVQSCSSSNRMSVQNLATVFGPNILRAKAEDPQSIMGGKRRAKQRPRFCSKFPSNTERELQMFFEDMCVPAGAALVQVLMLELIREHESLFAKAPPHSSTRLPGSLQAPPSRAPHLQPSSCSRQLSLPLISESSRPPESPQESR